MTVNPKKVKALIKALEEFLQELESEEEEEEEEEEPVKAKPAAKKRGKKVVEEEEEEEEENGDDDAPTLNELRTLAVKASKKATDGKEKVLAALQRHVMDQGHLLTPWSAHGHSTPRCGLKELVMQGIGREASDTF